jgi:hypothetical protein
MQRRVVGIALGCVVILALALAATAKRHGAAGGSPPPYRADPNTDMTLARLATFSGYPVYGLGASFRRMNLRWVDRVDQPTDYDGDTTRFPPQHYISLAYGDCVPVGADAPACAPSIEIQIWRACSRSRFLYTRSAGSNAPSRHYTMTTVRGVPAAVFSDMVEVYTGTVTIVVFGGESTRSRLTVVGRLQGMSASSRHVAGGQDLPAPVDGAMQGRLTC